MIRSIPQALTVSCLALLLPSSFSALTQDDERGLKPREYAEQLQKKFIRKRPQSKRPGPKAAAKYKPVTSDASIMPEGVDVGITFWRLREARKSDDQEVIEPKRIVKRIKGKEVVLSVKMTPTRATLETAFVDGEFLRLTLEVPFESYIYILNREEYAGGTMSDPYLVFPSETDLGQSAKGAPGRLIYIPNQVDYFEITRLRSDGPQKTAEEFTVLLAKQPIKELPPLKKGEGYKKIETDQFENWWREWGGRVWRFERVGGVGAAITKVEKSAGRLDGQLLTEADPEPQTVYHVERKSGDILLFTIRAPIQN